MSPERSPLPYDLINSAHDPADMFVYFRADDQLIGVMERGECYKITYNTPLTIPSGQVVEELCGYLDLVLNEQEKTIPILRNPTVRFQGEEEAHQFIPGSDPSAFVDLIVFADTQITSPT